MYEDENSLEEQIKSERLHFKDSVTNSLANLKA